MTPFPREEQVQEGRGGKVAFAVCTPTFHSSCFSSRASLLPLSMHSRKKWFFIHLCANTVLVLGMTEQWMWKSKSITFPLTFLPFQYLLFPFLPSFWGWENQGLVHNVRLGFYGSVTSQTSLCLLNHILVYETGNNDNSKSRVIMPVNVSVMKTTTTTTKQEIFVTLAKQGFLK